MSIKEFKRFATADRFLTQLQTNIAEFVKQLTKNIFLDGIIIEDITLTSGSNIVAHKLGRKPRGWIVIKKSSNANVWEDPTLESLPNIHLILSTSANTVVSLYIF